MGTKATPFQDRADAGRRLADAVAELHLDDPLVLGMPRGGVPVALEVAEGLGAPLDVLVVRKIGAPHNPEYGVGAIGEGGVELLDMGALEALGLDRDDLAGTIERERTELERRLRRFRGERRGADVEHRTVVLVDDGVATGVSATAAIRVLRARGADRVVLAVPVAAPQSIERLRQEADDTVCLAAPPGFMAVGAWYRDFTQTTDDTVERLLRDYHDRSDVDDDGRAAVAGRARRTSAVDPAEFTLEAGDVSLPGDLALPDDARGLVVFAHGSGSSRKSPRNRQVAAALNDAGLGTLLFDLLEEQEASNRARVFDIPLLAERLTRTLDWVAHHLPPMDVGLFGSSTGAAAALVASVERSDQVRAVVSRGGRVDMAAAHLERVKAPTLLIVGGADVEVLRLNRAAAGRLTVEHELSVIEGAGHLFQGPGELEQVADRAARWFLRHLGA